MRCPHLALPPAADKSGWPWMVESVALPDSMPGGRAWPRISIVTPSYNQGRFIEDTIRSVLLQGYPNLEYIVVDGGSTDMSVDIIRRYASWLSHWSSERDDGQSDAINKGFRLTTGDIVSWLNSDDLLAPGALVKIAVRFTGESEPAVLCGCAELRSTDLSQVLWAFDAPPIVTADILAYPEGRHIGQPSVFMSRTLLDFPSPLRCDLHYVMDLELWVRLSQKRSFVRLPDTLSWLRYHADAKTFRDNPRVFQEVETVLAEHADLLSPGRKAALIRASRRQQARSCVAVANNRAATQGRMASLRLLLKALSLDPRLPFARVFYGAIARIVLPAGLLRRALPPI